MKKEYYTPEEVAELFRVHRVTVYRWIASGKLDALKVGRGRRIDEKALAKLMESGLTPAPEKIGDPNTLAKIEKALAACDDLTDEQRENIMENLRKK